MKARLRRGAFVFCGVLAAHSGAVAAQSVEPLIVPAVTPDYRRDRNVAPYEQYEPSFEQIGVRIGSVVAYPTLSISSGSTNNVFVNNAQRRADGFVSVEGFVRANTDWSVHRLELVADVNSVRYLHQSLRNSDTYFLEGKGTLEINRSLQLVGDLQTAKYVETPYASDISSDVSILSQYTLLRPSLSLVRQVGRTRALLKAESLRYRFNTVQFADGSQRDQRYRDRTIRRFSGQFEYALSPSIAAVVQLSADHTGYPSLLPSGAANRDSHSFQALGGLSADLAGFARGSLLFGYNTRQYASSLYPDVGDLSIQATGEFFISPLTSLKFGAQRLLQDATLGNNGAYRDSRVSVEINHALLRNLLLTASAVRVKQQLIESGASSRQVFVLAKAQYQSSRTVGLVFSVQYGRSRSNGSGVGVPFDELRPLLTLRLRR